MITKFKIFENKLNEDCNAVYDVNTNKYYYAFNWEERGYDITFYYNKNKLKVSDDSHMSTWIEDHPTYYKVDFKDIYSKLKFAGRVYAIPKIITFWNFPTTREDFEKVLKDLEKEIGKDKVHIDDTWRVEILVDENGKQLVGEYWFKDESKRESYSEKIVPISDYLKTDNKEVVKYDSGKQPMKVKNWKDWQKPFESKRI